MALQCLVLCLLLEALFACSSARQLLGLPGGSIVVDEPSGQPSGQPVLLQALMNTSASTLVFQQPEFVLVPEAWKYITQRTPYMLNRPFMVTSQGPAAPTLIDFQLLSHRVVLEQQVTFSFSNVHLANIRKSDKLGIEWFMLSDGAVVALSNVVVVDLVCYQAPALALQAAQRSPSLLGYPPNVVSIVNSSCLMLHGSWRCFTNSLHYSQFAVTTTYNGGSAGDEQPGYTLVYNNVTHVCLSYLDQQCVQQHGATYCWNQQARQLDPGLFASADSPGSQWLSAGAIAGIAVSCCAFMIAAVAFAVLIVRKCSSSSNISKQELPQKGIEDASARSSVHCPSNVMPDVRLACRDSLDSTASGSFQSGCPLGVSLGVLLGAGSFGRVYKARWHSTDVAVKVMTCWPRELTKVLKEAELMMSMQHENVVRALNCSVVQRKAPEVLETAAAVRPTCNAAVSGPTAAAAMNTTDSAHSFFMCCPGNGAIVRCLSHVWPGSSNSMASLPPALKPKLQQNIMNSRQGSWHIKHQHSSIAGVAKDVHTSNAEARESPAGSGRMQSTSERSKNPGEHRSVSRTGSSYQPVINGSTEQRHPTREEPEGEPVEVWLVMELCTGGSLKEACSTPHDKLDMARLVSRLLEVASGMAYLNAKGVLHSDLKAANVLLKRTVHGSYGQVAKVSDFGLSSRLLADATHHSTQTTGTITHTAPEVLHTGRITAAADVYAFGIMMWELFTGKSAFSGAPYGSVALSVVNGARPPVPAGMPESYQLLMCSCWAQDPVQRPDFDQVGRCLLLMLDGLETMEGPLMDAGYLAVLAKPAGSEEDEAGDKAQQQVTEQLQPSAAVGSPAQQQGLHFQGSHGRSSAAASTGVDDSSNRRGGTFPGVSAPSSSEQRPQQSPSVQQYAVQMWQQEQRSPGRVPTAVVPGLISRHVQDL